MKKPDAPSKWRSNDKSRTALASVPAADVADKTSAKITNLFPKSADASPSRPAPEDGSKPDSKR